MKEQPRQPGKKPGISVTASSAVLWVLLTVTLAAGIIEVEPRGPVTPGTTLAISIDLPGRLRTVELEIVRHEPGDDSGPAAETVILEKTAVTDGDTKKIRDHNPQKKKIRLHLGLPLDIPAGTYIFRAYPGPAAPHHSYLVEIAAPTPGLITGVLASVKEIKGFFNDPYEVSRYFKGGGARTLARGDLYLMDARDYRVKARLTTSGDCLQPAWAPDGKRVAYIRWKNGTGQLWMLEVGAETSAAGPRRLMGKFSGGVLSPLWSPRGKEIAFLSGESLWIMEVAGETARRVTAARGIRQILAWNRGGDEVIYTAAPDPGAPFLTGRGGLWWPTGPGRKPEDRPVPVIHRVNIPRGNRRPQIYHEMWLWLPYLSPGGTRLMFSLPARPSGNMLWTRQGPGFTRAEMRREGFDPAWSPRGDGIVFVYAGKIKL